MTVQLLLQLQDEDIPCDICKSTGDAERMLLCDNCDFGYHIYCLTPPLYEIPATNWYCPDCKGIQYHEMNASKPSELILLIYLLSYCITFNN